MRTAIVQIGWPEYLAPLFRGRPILALLQIEVTTEQTQLNIKMHSEMAIKASIAILTSLDSIFLPDIPASVPPSGRR